MLSHWPSTITGRVIDEEKEELWISYNVLCVNLAPGKHMGICISVWRVPAISGSDWEVKFQAANSWVGRQRQDF